jgi:hypothetical protein
MIGLDGVQLTGMMTFGYKIIVTNSQRVVPFSPLLTIAALNIKKIKRVTLFLAEQQMGLILE